MKKLLLLLALLASPIWADNLGERRIDDTLTFYAQTLSPSTGAATDADGVPTYLIYEDESAEQLLSGSMALLDAGETDGFYSEQVTLSAANGFEVNKSYSVRIAVTVSSVATAKVDNFTVRSKQIDETPSATSSMGKLYASHVLFAGSATSNGTTTSVIDTAQTDATTDHAAGNILVWTSGTKAGESSLILGFNPATDTYVVNQPFTSASASGDQYTIVPNQDTWYGVTDSTSVILAAMGRVGRIIMLP